MPRPLCVSSFLFALLTAAACGAADFRIDTKVFVDQEVTPRCETVTLFQRGVVYDFLEAGAGEMTIYDPRVSKFTLLDPARKVKTEIGEEDLSRLVAALKTRAEKSRNRTIREAAAPNFKTSFDGQRQELSLVGNRLTYVAAAGGVSFPGDEEARDYFNFIDNYTRLNATVVGATPPQARLELNRALTQHNLFPATVKRVTRTGTALLGKESIARSEHTISWRLVRQDQDLIDKAARCRAQYTAVSFGQYRDLPESPR